MNDDVARWLDRCAECRKNKPLFVKAKCEMAAALRNGSPMAEKSMRLFADEHGICRQFESKEDPR